MELSQITTAFQKILIYGPGKTGKSALAGTLAEGMKVIYNDAEDGVKTLMQLPAAFQANVQVTQYPDTQEYPIFIESVLKILKGAPVFVCDKHAKVDCMICKANKASGVSQHINAADPNTVYVFDSFTQLRLSAMWQRYRKVYKGKEPEDVKFEWDDWHWLKFVMEKVGGNIQAARGHIVVITHEESVEQEDKRKQIVPVAGSENTNKVFARFFDHVIYTRKVNGRVAYLSKLTSSNDAFCGSRSSYALEDMAADKVSLLPFFKPELVGSKELQGMGAYSFMKALKKEAPANAAQDKKDAEK